MLISLGHDTEVFGKKDGKIIPLSPDILTGTKEKPQEISKHASLQLDNVLCEITQPPAEHNHEFATLCKASKRDAEKWMEANHGISLIYKSHHTFKLNDVLTPWAMTNGCSVDFTADTNDPVKKLDMSLFTTLKTASGHIHIGVSDPDEMTMANKIQYVRALDFALGAPLALLHNDPLRRKLYGRAARFRSKPYGFEYRTPDNWWFGQGDPYLYIAIYDVIYNTMSVSLEQGPWSDINNHHSALCEAINIGDKKMIMDAMKYNPFYHLDYKKGVKRRSKRKPYGQGYSPSQFHAPGVGITTTTNTTVNGPDWQVVDDSAEDEDDEDGEQF